MGARYRAAGDRIDYTPAAPVTAGDVVVREELVAVATEDLEANRLASLAASGVFDVDKGEVEFDAGDDVYYDTTGEVATADSSDAYFGKAVADAAEGDATVRAKLIQRKPLESVATPVLGTPTATPERTPEATPEETPEATAEATPEVTPEVTPTATPEPTPEQTPPATPEPTPEQTPPATPEPTPEQTPPATPEPTPEATPEQTPEATPIPTPTPGDGLLVVGAGTAGANGLYCPQGLYNGCTYYDLVEPLGNYQIRYEGATKWVICNLGVPEYEMDAVEPDPCTTDLTATWTAVGAGQNPAPSVNWSAGCPAPTPEPTPEATPEATPPGTPEATPEATPTPTPEATPTPE